METTWKTHGKSILNPWSQTDLCHWGHLKSTHARCILTRLSQAGALGAALAALGARATLSSVCFFMYSHAARSFSSDLAVVLKWLCVRTKRGWTQQAGKAKALGTKGVGLSRRKPGSFTWLRKTSSRSSAQKMARFHIDEILLFSLLFNILYRSTLTRSEMLMEVQRTPPIPVEDFMVICLGPCPLPFHGTRTAPDAQLHKTSNNNASDRASVLVCLRRNRRLWLQPVLGHWDTGCVEIGPEVASRSNWHDCMCMCIMCIQ